MGNIILGDALDTLKKLPSSSVDLIHTSPPYNIDRPYSSDLRDSQDHADYKDFIHECIMEMKRVVRPGGSIFWQTGYTVPDGTAQEMLPLDILTHPMFTEGSDPVHLWDRIIWRYFGGHAFTRKFTNKHETIMWFVKPGADPTFDVDSVREKAKEYDKRNNFWGRNPGNVWEVDRVAFGTSSQTSHIAVFPEEISERIVRACSQPGDVVLDPFAGSGTLPKVAHGLGRQWIGIEISAEYAHEAGIRVGYQQKSEQDTLVAELIKMHIFRDRPGAAGIRTIEDKLDLWLASCDASAQSAKFWKEVDAVFHDRNGRNAQKALVWEYYDRCFDQRGSSDPVVLADSLLGRRYRLRKRLNGVSRYRSALTALENIVNQRRNKESWTSYLRALLMAEPSTFRVVGETVELDPKPRQLSGSSDDNHADASMDADEHEGLQGRLLA